MHLSQIYAAFLLFLSVVFCSAASLPSVAARAATAANTIFLHRATIQYTAPSSSPSPLSSSSSSVSLPSVPSCPHISCSYLLHFSSSSAAIRFRSLIQSNEIPSIHSNSIEFIHFIPESAYLVHVSPAELSNTFSSLAAFSASANEPFTPGSALYPNVILFQPEWKLSDSVLPFTESATIESRSHVSSSSDLSSLPDLLASHAQILKSYLNADDQSKTRQTQSTESSESPVRFSIRMIPSAFKSKSAALAAIAHAREHIQSLLSSALPSLSTEDIQSLVSLNLVSRSQWVITLSPLVHSASSSVLTYLSSLSHVQWIDRRHEVKTMNSAAKRIIQDPGLYSTVNTPDNTLDWLRGVGLTGSNQLIGVGDSILDTQNCFFKDSQHSVQFCRDCLIDSEKCVFGTPACRNPATKNSHRKVAAYWEMTDAGMTDAAHGTHVAGTILGAPPVGEGGSAIAQFSGVAPDARIVFTQLGAGSAAEKLELPEDLHARYFPWTFYQGARISSNSWGQVSAHFYSSDSSEIDQFSHEYQDFLVVFAAGNQGQGPVYSAPGDQLSSEAFSKNAIVVGATQSFFTHFRNEMNTVSTKILTDWLSRVMCRDVYSISVTGEKSIFQTINAKISTPNVFTTENAMKSYYCSRWQSTGSSYGCQAFKAAPGSRDREGMAYFAKLGPMAGAPAASGIGPCVDLNNAMYDAYQNALSFHEYSVTSFSSAGPTKDNRIKPDLCAPGDTLLSARSGPVSKSSQCSVDTTIAAMAGTSMAAPVISASAALLRQYFMDGFYSTGLRAPAAGFAPSAALVKAMLLHSTVDTVGVGVSDPDIPRDDSKTSNYSSIGGTRRAKYQGFGRIQLRNVLKLAPSLQPGVLFPSLAGQGQAPPGALFVFDRCSSIGSSHSPIANGQTHQYDFTVTDASHPFRATLVWTDKESFPGSTLALINDLDLSLIDLSTNTRYQGNQHIYSFSPTINPRDSWNNVEQIIISPASLSVGSYRLMVQGTRVSTGDPQSYSLVVSFTSGSTMNEITNTTSACTFRTDISIDIDWSDPVDYQKRFWIIAFVLVTIAVVIYLIWKNWPKIKGYWHRVRGQGMGFGGRSVSSASPQSNDIGLSNFESARQGFLSADSQASDSAAYRQLDERRAAAAQAAMDRARRSRDPNFRDNVL